MNENLLRLIERFVSDRDTSIETANQIEVALDDEFPDDDYLQQTVEMLAMYRPEGGDFLFDTSAIRQRLAETASYLSEN
jgi:hypothetical protein